MNNAVPPSLPPQQPQPVYPVQPQQAQPPMRKCKKCGSTRLQAVSVTKGKIKKRGCLAMCFHIFMIFITLGLWVIIPLLRGGSKGKIKTEIQFVCLDCGTKQ